MRYLFTYMLLLFLMSCQTSKKGLDASTVKNNGLVISMKKTICYGTCPAYEIKIYDNLKVSLKGEKYLDLIGSFEAKISKSRLSELSQMFSEANFFEFENKYYKAFSDLPTTYILFSQDGQSKEIMDYYGAPEVLKKLEEEVAMLLDELDWKKVGE